MKIPISLPSRPVKVPCILAGALELAAPASAGVVDGVRKVDGLTFYFGVVPAAVTRGHPAGHVERTSYVGTSLRAG